MDRWKIAEIVEWLEPSCKVHWGKGKSGELRVRSFQHDSRKVQEGDLFFALRGERFDGHDGLLEVAQRGAIAAVVSEWRGSFDLWQQEGMTFIEVKDVQGALRQLARKVFSFRKQKAVGVTGSVGKTTTKEFIATLLQAGFDVEKTLGNLNSQVGLPLSLLNDMREEALFVMEMGMSQSGEISRLVAMAPPEIALVTRIALAHVAAFPDGLEGIAQAKGEILTHPKTQYGVIHAQAISFKGIAQRGSCKKITYGWKWEFPTADVVLNQEGTEYWIEEKKGGGSPRFVLPFSAPHLCENFLGAAVVCRLMGMEWSLILSRIDQLKTYKNRFEWVEKKGIRFLNDSYNANPCSMKAALDYFQGLQVSGRKGAVLGSMRELGAFCRDSHFELGQRAAEVFDYVICVGSECQPAVDCLKEKGRSIIFCNSFEEARGYLFDWIKSGDAVLLKGSNSHQLWKILE